MTKWLTTSINQLKLATSQEKFPTSNIKYKELDDKNNINNRKNKENTI